MKLSFFGATRTTTGSKFLLEVDNRRLLMECGLFQGRRAKSIEYSTKLPFAPASVDAMLLSHAHIDHSGVIPILCRDGFQGPIYCTDATADLCAILLRDSAYIQEQDAVWLTKKNAKKGLPPVPPLYTQADAEACLRQFRAVRYDHPTPVLPGVTATWLDAGHILGSAMIVLDVQERGRRLRLVFSGDLGRGNNDILRDPARPQEVDYLMIESTYGNRAHESLADVNDHVCTIINRAVEQRGKVIMPAFSVGRTQQLLYTVYQLTKSRCIPVLPVYVDSPLSAQATAVFQAHPECFNPQFRAVMFNGSNPFSMPNLHYIGTVAESMALNDHPGPCIIISASGMAEAGRVRHHIRNAISDPRNTILIAGWCAQHTLGARLASGHKEVTIFGEPYQVRAKVETINAFSGHADCHELRAWVKQLTGPLRGIYCIHGEEPAATALADDLRAAHPTATVRVPAFADSVELP